MTALLEQVPVVVRSRLRPPDLHPDELIRPRLLDRLETFDEPAILLAAPSGAGKTVLLSQWVRSTGARYAWVSLGPSKVGLCDMWSAILQALEPLCHDRHPTALRDRTDPQTLLNRVIPALLNKLTVTEPLLLFLDGLNAVVDPRAKESLTHFVLQLPPHVRVVLATNRPAAGPVAQLRALGRLAELTNDDLRFTGSEAHRLLGVVAKRAVSEDEAARIQRGVDGWAVGLRLAGLAMRHGRAGGLPRELVDYVHAEVLGKATPSERAAIVQTSVLCELRPARVNAVTGTWATRALASFARSSMFLQPTADGWICHAALRATAAEHLRQCEPELRANLHHRALRLFEREGNLLAAAEHALESGKPHRAGEMLAAAWPSARPGDLLQRVGRLGAELAGPVARSAAAAALARGDADMAAHLLSGSGPDRHRAVRALTFLQRGELADARTCLAAPAEEDAADAWWIVVHQLATGLIGLWDGRTDEALSELHASATAATKMDYPDARVRALDGMVACAATRGDDDTARVAAKEAVGTYAQDPLRATVPVISIACLQLSGDEVPVLANPSPAQSCGPHHAAFAEFLRAAAAQRAAQPVAYRLAQSRGRSLLKPEQAGTLLKNLLVDQRCGSIDSAAGARNRLTSRELVILRALSGPLTLREIARELHVSHNTVKTQVGSLFRKLDAHDRTAAVQTAREHGLIPRA
ncbi:LuxR C-terminal-related transcriptional regulator [Mycobacterium sp. 050272]|uniref:helix-turn-helix transcriptional regulator n=1 Tax=Mycobacteriaceae TaxID=1762 RepID=UPI003192AC3A